jgi:hypothetical protein
MCLERHLEDADLGRSAVIMGYLSPTQIAESGAEQPLKNESAIWLSTLTLEK